jgi:hypothetical protein
VTRLQPDRVRTIEFGYRTLPGAAPRSRSWASRHGEGLQRIAEEAVMITGDGNLVEVQAALRYRVTDPHVFLFEVSDPEAVLRSATEAVLREAVASRPFLELLTTGHRLFQQDVLSRLEARCAAYGPNGLGVRLDGLSLGDLHPPLEVVQAYHDIARAMETRVGSSTRRERRNSDGETPPRRRRYRSSGRPGGPHGTGAASDGGAGDVPGPRANTRRAVVASGGGAVRRVVEDLLKKQNRRKCIAIISSAAGVAASAGDPDRLSSILGRGGSVARRTREVDRGGREDAGSAAITSV